VRAGFDQNSGLVMQMTRTRKENEMSDRIPAEVFPLAEFIADELIARGWKTEDAAIRMGGTTDLEIAKDLLALDLLMCAHSDNLLVGDRMFAGLAKAFDVSEECFRNLDRTWRDNPSRRSEWTCPENLFGPISRRSLIVPVVTRR
jgi:hypothetical protein